MATSYKVQPGDHLTRIARQFGFPDFNTIWNDAQNAQLKQLRQNPNVLLPGDVLIIPDKHVKSEARGTDGAHSFQVETLTLKLRLKLEDLYGKPLANRKYRLLLEGDPRSDLTNAEGTLEQVISDKAEFVALQTQPIDGAPTVIEIPIKIGHLNPVTEVSGWAARLNNLGYNASSHAIPAPVSGQKAEDQFHELPLKEREQVRSAIEEFQCDQKLTVDGKCGSVTQARLKEAHGC